MGAGDLGDGTGRFGHGPAAERVPGDEGEALPLTAVEHRVGRPVVEVVAVLHRDHGGERRGPVELRLVDVRHADVADLALLLQLDQRPEGVLQGHLGVDGVELVQRDLLDTQPSQASFAGLAQVLGTAVGPPLPGAVPAHPSLGGDDQVVGVGSERLGDELLAHVRSVGVGGVDAVDAELERPAQDGSRCRPVGWRAPDAVAGDAHGAEAEAVDGEVFA